MSGISDLTPQEKKNVEEFKKRVENDLSPKLKEDPTLFYRFLKARNFNLDDAESLLRKHIAWRKLYDVDNILTDYKPPEVLLKYFPMSLLGYDEDGSPVKFCPLGGWDVKGLLKSAKLTDLVKYNTMTIETDLLRLKVQSEKLGKAVTQITYVYDVGKLSFSRATNKSEIDFFMYGITLFQDNYPERIKHVYAINSSFYFTIFYSVIKHVIASSIFDKVKIFGTDDYQEEFSQMLDPKELPAFLGGQKTDPDGNPLCHTFVGHGSLVPETFYLTKSQKSLSKEPGVKKLVVTRFSSSHLKFEITEPESFLEWEFETQSRDIGFGVFFRDESLRINKTVELLPKQKIDTSHEPETGLCKCERPGTYILVFDNSYSWIHSKEVYYRVKVVHQNERSVPGLKP